MIHYFGDKSGGFIGVDTSQRVREVPGYLFGRGADTPGDISTIQERIWNPTDLGTTIPIEEVSDDWVTALGFEDAPLIVRPGRQLRAPRESRAPREPEWAEPNPLPGKSFLVPLVPLDEYLAFMASGIDAGDESTDIRFPWETTSLQSGLTLVGSIGSIVFLMVLALLVCV